MIKTHQRTWLSQQINQSIAFALFSLSICPNLAHAASSSALAELERLDSAATLLLYVSDSARPRSFPSLKQCQFKPTEAKKLLMVIHPRLDQGRKKAESSLMAQKSRQSDTSAKWEKTCSHSCHCGLYASILDEISDQGLDDQSKETMRRLYKKAQLMTSKEAEACAVQASKWFCKSSLLKELRKEAKDFPDPASRPQMGFDSVHK